ncbi:MAG: hypothetical protein HUU06_01125 [Planctomycetaceae bacterium]|nr:hypothetical protein [Planctomycetota bacterium]NUN51374.1 hypothetical protein [Planctomycetaceae bacterium]
MRDPALPVLAFLALLVLPAAPAGTGPAPGPARARYSEKLREVSVRTTWWGEPAHEVKRIPVTRFRASMPLDAGVDLPGTLDGGSVLALAFSREEDGFEEEDLTLLDFSSDHCSWKPGGRSARWFLPPFLMATARWSDTRLSVSLKGILEHLADGVVEEGETGTLGLGVGARVFLGDLDGGEGADFLFSGTASCTASTRPGPYGLDYEGDVIDLWKVRISCSLEGAPCDGGCPPIDDGGDDYYYYY